MSTTTTTKTRILVAPDKFKGSLTAAQVAEALATGLLRHETPGIEVQTLPLADGGDGSVAAALSAGFQALTVPITGPTGNPTTTVAFDGNTAVVEVATTSGLQMLPPGQPAPLTSSSVGVGQAVRAVLARRPARVVLALGGSANTDGGAGMLSALGVVFRDALGRPFVPTGGTLGRITDVDLTGLVDLDGVELVAAIDVQNPLLGPGGAVAVYGPQKGAAPADVEVLEDGLGCLIRRLWEVGWPAVEAAGVPGAGAAGASATLRCCWAPGWSRGRTSFWICSASISKRPAATWSSPARGSWTPRHCPASCPWSWPAAQPRHRFSPSSGTTPCTWTACRPTASSRSMR